MARMIHHVELHRSNVPGLEAMTLLSNHHFPRHSHDQLGIGVVTIGAHRSWSGLGQVQASAGDVIMANPGEMHDGVPLDGAARGWRIAYLDPALVRHEVEDEGLAEIEVVRPVARDPWLARYVARLFTCLTGPYSDAFAQEEALIRVLACVLHRHSTRPQSYGDGPSPSVSRARQRLDSAPNEPTSLAELASLAGVSRFQLIRAFMGQVGITPHAYLIQRRVCLARKFLAAGQTPVQAAMEAGFADQSHMTRVFVRYLGITPARYRAAVA